MNRRKQVSLPRCLPLLPIRIETPSRHQAMQVQVLNQRLSPGVQHRRQPNLSVQVPLTEFHQHFRRGSKQQRVNETRVGPRQPVQLMGQGKDDVKLGTGSSRCRSASTHCRPLLSLAGWAMPIRQLL